MGNDKEKISIGKEKRNIPEVSDNASDPVTIANVNIYIIKMLKILSLQDHISI